MISTTLKHYKDNFQSNLDAFLKKYVDNTKLIFLQKELEKYNYFLNVLITSKTTSESLKFQTFGEFLDINKPEYIGIDFKKNPDNYITSIRRIIGFISDEINTPILSSKANRSDNITPLGNSSKVIIETENYNENLINDPLFSPENEYMILKETFIEDFHSRTAHLKDEEAYLFHDFDFDFKDWENKQKEEIKKSFLKLVKELNQNKIFFFGCSFDNYKHNYDKRLSEFLEYYVDANENDFLKDELKFLENILSDIQNSEAAHDGHSLTGYDNFSKAYDFVSIIGYKQYFFSHNKKEAFLDEKRQELINKQKIINDVSTNNHPDELGHKKRVKFGIKKMTGTLKSSEIEQREIDIQVNKKEDDFQNYNLMPTIEDYLEEFKTDINGDGYETLINALYEYFTNGTFPVLEGKIKFKKINKKRVGWALKELYKSEKTDNLEIEYFRFAQENINLFEKEVIIMENFNKSNFYKTFTSNPSK